MTRRKHLLQQRITTSEQNVVFAQSYGDGWRVEIELHQYDIRQSESQSQWNLLGPTVTCFCHSSYCLLYVMSLASLYS